MVIGSEDLKSLLLAIRRGFGVNSGSAKPPLSSEIPDLLLMEDIFMQTAMN